MDLSDLVVDQYQKPDMVAQVKMFFNEESEVMINDFVEVRFHLSFFPDLYIFI